MHSSSILSVCYIKNSAVIHSRSQICWHIKLYVSDNYRKSEISTKFIIKSFVDYPNLPDFSGIYEKWMKIWQLPAINCCWIFDIAWKKYEWWTWCGQIFLIHKQVPKNVHLLIACEISVSSKDRYLWGICFADAVL